METATLVDISSREAPLQDIVLTGDKFLIGRGLQNSRVIEDLNISRTHCILEHSNGEWCIWDKSSNGTMLNGQLLDKTRSHTLTNGDVIGLSDAIKYMFQKSTHDSDEATVNANEKALSDNEICDIAETVIAEVEALSDADFYTNGFDETVFGEKNSESLNPSQLLSGKNKQNVTNKIKSGINGIRTIGPINIHRPEVVNIIQKTSAPSNPQQHLITAYLHQPNGPKSEQQQLQVKSNSAEPGPSKPIQDSGVSSMSQQPSCSKNSAVQDQKSNLDFVEDELQCSICTEMFVKAVTLPCSHTFCKFCITQWMKNQNVCPICRTKITTHHPTLVLDNFIEKILENASEEVKNHRRELIAEREAALAPPTAATSSNSAPGGRQTAAPIEISSEEDNSDNDNDSNEDDEGMSYSDDWDYDYGFDDYEEDYNGVPGRYYGGYGHCYSCGQRGHWANGCPNRRKR